MLAALNRLRDDKHSVFTETVACAAAADTSTSTEVTQNQSAVPATDRIRNPELMREIGKK